MFYSLCIILYSFIPYGWYGKEIENKMIERWANSILIISKTTYSVHYIENVYDIKEYSRSTIYISNHASLFDAPLLISITNGKIRMMCKKELFKVPIFGYAMKRTEFISLDRENKRQAIYDIKHAEKSVRKNNLLWISPEGTRTKDGAIGKFKSGGFRIAIQTSSDILPIYIHRSSSIVQSGSLMINRETNVEIIVGKRIDISNFDIGTLHDLMEKTRNSIIDMSNAKNSSYT